VAAHREEEIDKRGRIAAPIKRNHHLRGARVIREIRILANGTAHRTARGAGVRSTAYRGVREKGSFT